MGKSYLLKETIGRKFVKALTTKERINIFRKNKINMNTGN